MIRPAHTHQRFMAMDDEPEPYRVDCPACLVNKLVRAGERCIQALAATGAPNCEAAKEMKAALAPIVGVQCTRCGVLITSEWFRGGGTCRNVAACQRRQAKNKKEGT